METKNINFGTNDTALIALSIKMQIKYLEESLQEIRDKGCFRQEYTNDIREMLANYKRIYKQFDQYSEIVDRFVRELDN